jgi:hypothetical protein
VKSYKTKGITVFNYNTPIEIENKVIEGLHEDIDEATLIYEKARYSNEECTKWDVDTIKKFL